MSHGQTIKCLFHRAAAGLNFLVITFLVADVVASAEHPRLYEAAVPRKQTEVLESNKMHPIATPSVATNYLMLSKTGSANADLHAFIPRLVVYWSVRLLVTRVLAPAAGRQAGRAVCDKPKATTSAVTTTVIAVLINPPAWVDPAIIRSIVWAATADSCRD